MLLTSRLFRGNRVVLMVVGAVVEASASIPEGSKRPHDPARGETDEEGHPCLP
jgi:hypothetical protein